MSIIENRIFEKVKEIQKIMSEEGHDGEYLAITINRQGVISFNNNYWETDEKIDFVDIDKLLKLKGE